MCAALAFPFCALQCCDAIFCTVDIITDKESGRSRGFAFVTFETEEAATSALEMDNKVQATFCFVGCFGPSVLIFSCPFDITH